MADTVTFNANESWDLDNDNLTYTWTSNIDGNLAGDFGACGGNANGSFFLGNPWFSSHDCLSDGLHQITLEVCDDQGTALPNLDRPSSQISPQC